MLIFTLFIQYGICDPGSGGAAADHRFEVTFGGPMVWLISGPCGTAIVFLVAFFCARVLLGCTAQHFPHTKFHLSALGSV